MAATLSKETAPAQSVRYGPELDMLNAHFNENLECPTSCWFRDSSTAPITQLDLWFPSFRMRAPGGSASPGKPTPSRR